MKHKFIVKKVCNHKTVNQCSNDIITKIKSLMKNNIDSINYHISIFHEKNNHIIWLFLYDNDKIHESESDGETVYNNSKTIKKFSGTKPTLSEIKNALK